MNVENQKKLYNYAVKLLARHSYYSDVLREKLAKKGVGTKEDVDKVIAKLKKYKFINDKEYVRVYIKDQLVRKPQGIKLLKQKLFQKGIKGDFVEKELALYEPREVEFAKIALEKKARLIDPSLSLNKRKEKLFRFLVGRGFSVGVIMEVFNKLLPNSTSHNKLSPAVQVGK
jgi:regulatory protein